MARYVIDAGALIRLVSEGVPVLPDNELLAPTLIRSQVLSMLHEAVHRGELTRDEARERLARINATKLRLLGDAVLRKVAWEIADRLDWASTFDAEYLALTRLQGDALVTLDPNLAQAAEGIVQTAPFEALTRP